VSCRCLGTCERSSVTQESCHLAVTAKYFFIHPCQIAVGHVAALEHSQAGRQDLEPRDAWWLRSPPEQGGGVWSHETCGGTGALLSREVGSRAARCVVVPEPSRMGWPGPVSRDMRQHVVTRPASCLSF
jgi:hypothetical protein